jgi:hypothetical protein
MHSSKQPIYLNSPWYPYRPGQPPPDVERAAIERRLAVESIDRDLTASICGDPPPGQSALDQRRARQAVTPIGTAKQRYSASRG